MSLLSVRHVKKAWFGRPVLQDVNLELNAGQRVALGGENGSGKSTLLNLIAGDVALEPEDGEILLAAGVRLGYLRQIWQDMPDDRLTNGELLRLEQQLNELETRISQGDRKALQRYGDAVLHFESSGGYDFAHQLREALYGLGLDETIWERPTETLSGGERMRLHLAAELVRDPDLLLLDEPTNHLDLKSLAWLEERLIAFRGALLFVSHDRTFMDRVATQVAWLSAGSLDVVTGGYTHFRAVKAEQDRHLKLEIKAVERRLRHEQEVAQTMYSHRKISQYHNRTRRAEQEAARLRQVREKARDQEKTIRPRFVKKADDSDPGRVVLRLEGLAGGYDQPLFQDVDLTLLARDKAVLLGPNGCGKSTFLGILSGRLAARSGRFLWSAGVTAAELPQLPVFADEQRTPLQEVQIQRPGKSETFYRSALVRYGFGSDEWGKTIAVLSGGERARLALLSLVLQEPSVLLLDEPTNHLDIRSREILEQALLDFDGAVLSISHDRYFIARTAGRLLGFAAGSILPFDSLSAWEERNRAEAEASRPAVKPAHSRALRRKEEAARRQALADLEKRLQDVETEIALSEAAIRPETTPDEYRALAALHQLQEELTDSYLALLEAAD